MAYQDSRKIFDSRLGISSGKVLGTKPVSKFGYNLDIDTSAEETVWAAGGEYVVPTDGETLNISSTSALDASTGIGAQYLYITGVDSNYDLAEEYIFTNGTNTVTTTTQWRGIHRVAVALAGSNQKNAGDITLTQSTSGLVLAFVPAEESITQQMIYTVPRGYTGYIQNLEVNAAKNAGGALPKVTIEVYSFNPLSNCRYTLQDIIIDTSVTNQEIFNWPVANPSNEFTTIYLNASTDTNNTRVYARGFLILVKND